MFFCLKSTRSFVFEMMFLWLKIAGYYSFRCVNSYMCINFRNFVAFNTKFIWTEKLE